MSLTYSRRRWQLRVDNHAECEITAFSRSIHGRQKIRRLAVVKLSFDLGRKTLPVPTTGPHNDGGKAFGARAAGLDSLLFPLRRRYRVQDRVDGRRRRAERAAPVDGRRPCEAATVTAQTPRSSESLCGNPAVTSACRQSRRRGVGGGRFVQTKGNISKLAPGGFAKQRVVRFDPGDCCSDDQCRG